VYNDKVGEARHSKQDSGRVDAGVSSVRALDCGNRECGGLGSSHRAPHSQQPWGCRVKGELRGPSSAVEPETELQISPSPPPPLFLVFPIFGFKELV